MGCWRTRWSGDDLIFLVLKGIYTLDILQHADCVYEVHKCLQDGQIDARQDEYR